MKILGVIPARYESTRFEGKPLKVICGKPMIWWTYEQVKKSKKVTDIVVATDDERIKSVCEELNMNVIMTKVSHKMMLERVQEVSDMIDADIYISIAGDEPLIEPENIDKIASVFEKGKFEVANLKTKITNPVDVINWTTMKIITDENDFVLFASRSPIPYPKSALNITYYKHMGTYALTKNALDYFVNTPRGPIEQIEDFDLLRFIEHGMKVKVIDVKSSTISVDTPKDLVRVEKILKKKMK